MKHPENLAIAGLNWRDHGGTGDPLLMVHGLGGSLANWDAVGPRLAKERRVLALDLPGFGLSPPRHDYKLSTHVEAVADFIEATDRPVILMGNSMGGMVCEYVAARRPELVERLILVSPATPPRLPDAKIHWPTVARLTTEAVPGLGTVLGKAVSRRMSPEQIVHLSLRMITQDPSRIPPEIVDEFIDLARERVNFPWAAAALNMSANSIAMVYKRPRDFVREIRKITAPTLVVHGLDDPIVSPTAVEWLCSLRSDWKLVQMDDTGHTPQLDAPVRFSRVVEEWLETGS